MKMIIAMFCNNIELFPCNRFNWMCSYEEHFHYTTIHMASTTNEKSKIALLKAIGFKNIHS